MKLSVALQKLNALDRRWIFIGVFVAVAVPFFIPVSFVAEPTPTTLTFDRALGEALNRNQPIVLDVDFGPQTMAEMEPLLQAVLHRVFQSKRPVILLTFMTESAAPLRTVLARMEQTYQLRYGQDYVFLGYASAYAYTMHGLGTSFGNYFHADDRGTPIEKLPLMKNVHSLRDVSAVVNIASNSFPKFWIQYAVTPFDIDFLAGTTAVQAAEYFPFLQTGQLKGLLGGGRAAAEYETLLLRSGVLTRRGDATRGLGSQSLALLVILAFIAIGNVGWLAARRAGRTS